jgi:hypothetical protein
VRYIGLNASGMPVFRRRDVDIMINETTMSRTGVFSTFQARGGRHDLARAIVSAGVGSAPRCPTPL